MNDFVENKVNEWAQNDPEIREVNLRIIHLEKKLFRFYTPHRYFDSNFFSRLKNWLKNLNDSKEQKILFEIIPNLFYIGEQELDSLYRTAYNIEFARWLLDQTSIDITLSDIQNRINEEITETWFCPITDSFIINDFIKVNNIPSRLDLRPDWHTLTQLGNKNLIQDYVNTEGIRRIVLLEDFVGSGSQASSRISFACETFPNIAILCISLITCPIGVSTLYILSTQYPNLTIKSIIEIPDSYLISENRVTSEPVFHNDVRNLANKTYLTVTNGVHPGPKPYNPLGYKKTGGLIILSANVPDNTIPMIHHTSDTWKALFKRITRV
jgi:hypothetical protein